MSFKPKDVLVPCLSEPLDLNQFFPYQFSVLAQQMSEFIAQIYREKYGLTRFEWRVIATIGQHGKISARQICQFTHLDKMQASRAINKLTQSASISQQNSEQDRRTILLSLTDSGKEMYQEIIPLVVEQEQVLLQGLSAEEIKQFKQITQKLSAQLAQRPQAER